MAHILETVEEMQFMIDSMQRMYIVTQDLFNAADDSAKSQRKHKILPIIGGNKSLI